MADCGICFSPIEKEDNPQGLLNSCDHVFCHLCISAWAASTNTCPHCKKRFNRITTVMVTKDSETGAEKEEVKVQKIRKRNLRVDDESSDEDDEVGPNGMSRLVVLCKICQDPVILKEMVSCERRNCEYVAHQRCLGLTGELPDRWFCVEHGGTEQGPTEPPPPAEVFTPMPDLPIGTLGTGEVKDLEALNDVMTAQRNNGLAELRRRKENREAEAKRKRAEAAAKAVLVVPGKKRAREEPPQLLSLEELERKIYIEELANLRDLQHHSRVARGQEIGLRMDTWDSMGNMVIRQKSQKEEEADTKRYQEEQARVEAILKQRARACAQSYVERVREARKQHEEAAAQRQVLREHAALLKLQSLISKRRTATPKKQE